MTINIVLESEIELLCDECGNYLENSERSNNSISDVKPCEKCLTQKYSEGYDDGLNKTNED